MTRSSQTALIAELEAELAGVRADNARLRLLLDAKGAPGELRHRQRNTLSVLRTIVRASAEPAEDLETYVSHFEDRLDAIGRVQAAIDSAGAVDLAYFIATELLIYGAHEGQQARISGPTVHLLPAAAQPFALALNELSINAIEHGCLLQPSGRLTVTWHVATEEADRAFFTFVWKEIGSSGLVTPSRRGFGTEVLTGMLGYELQAKTVLAFEPDGLRCTIRFPLLAQFGRVADPA